MRFQKRSKLCVSAEQTRTLLSNLMSLFSFYIINIIDMFIKIQVGVRVYLVQPQNVSSCWQVPTAITTGHSFLILLEILQQLKQRQGLMAFHLPSPLVMRMLSSSFALSSFLIVRRGVGYAVLVGHYVRLSKPVANQRMTQRFQPLHGLGTAMTSTTLEQLMNCVWILKEVIISLADYRFSQTYFILKYCRDFIEGFFS